MTANKQSSSLDTRRQIVRLRFTHREWLIWPSWTSFTILFNDCMWHQKRSCLCCFSFGQLSSWKKFKSSHGFCGSNLISCVSHYLSWFSKLQSEIFSVTWSIWSNISCIVTRNSKLSYIFCQSLRYIYGDTHEMRYDTRRSWTGE